MDTFFKIVYVSSVSLKIFSLHTWQDFKEVEWTLVNSHWDFLEKNNQNTVKRCALRPLCYHSSSTELLQQKDYRSTMCFKGQAREKSFLESIHRWNTAYDVCLTVDFSEKDLFRAAYEFWLHFDDHKLLFHGGEKVLLKIMLLWWKSPNCLLWEEDAVCAKELLKTWI